MLCRAAENNVFAADLERAAKHLLVEITTVSLNAQRIYGGLWIKEANRFSAIPIISTREVFFQPNVETDEEIATPHFSYFELGDSGSTVAPGNG